MVLKYLTINKKTGKAEWNYLDNIEYAQTYLDENDRRIIKFRIGKGDLTCIPIEEHGYLLNDNGKTIERI